MNREIKFRGLYNGTWVYGNLIQGTIDGRKFCQIEKSDSNDFNSWEVDPDSVGQFIDREDCEGVDMYEGDIVRSQGHFTYTIEWNDRNSSFMAKSLVGGAYYTMDSVNVQGALIIGNICETPKLVS